MHRSPSARAQRRSERRDRRAFPLLLLLLCAAPAVHAQQTRVPVRDIGPVTATSADTFVGLLGLVQFSDGRVLINDIVQRRIVLLDASLKRVAIVADTGAGAMAPYGRTSMPIIPFFGDSALYPDYGSASILVIGPDGKMARAFAHPRAADLIYIGQSASGIDAQGRLAYRGRIVIRRNPAGGPQIAIDSAPVLRADFASRAIDTVGFVKMPTSKPMLRVPAASGMMQFKETVVPVTLIDEWTVHADGSIAILRSSDYHIDWISPDGKMESTPKMPMDWIRITEEDKRRIIDSVRRAADTRPIEARSRTIEEAASSGGTTNLELVTLPNGTKVVPIITEVVPPEEIPDYRPPFRAGAMKADPDGNLWILPFTSAQSRNGGLVYDIVNRRGELTERVEVPAGRSVAGFGKGGVVYLMVGDRTNGFRIERARFK